MVVILNFGSQFSHLIARRLRDLGVKAEILRFGAAISEIKALKPDGIILSGSPSSVLANGPFPRKEIFELGIPALGICYGLQVMTHMLGGKIVKGKRKEYGRETLSLKRKSRLFSGLAKKQIVWFSHGDQALKIPKGFIAIASTDHCRNAAVSDEKRGLYGVQFHPEVVHTENGKKILSNFLFGICAAKKDWKIFQVKKELIKSLKSGLGSEHVLIGISGGVDSLVAATLLFQAIGNKLHAVFVDTGLLRKNEVEEVTKSLKKQGFKNLIVVDAQKIFLNKLKNVTDPEEKRKIIGHAFIDVFQNIIKQKLGQYSIKYFAQGT